MDLCKSILILFLIADLSLCEMDLKLILEERLQELKDRAKDMYGGVSKKNTVKLWEIELEDRLAYPRGDKQKLQEISKKWLEYYTCSVRSLDRLTASGALPARSVSAYVGAAPRLWCALCVAPGETVVWMNAEYLTNLTFASLELKENMVLSGEVLTIYNVRESDAGVYKCQVGSGDGGLTLLEVLDNDEGYDVVVKHNENATQKYTTTQYLEGSLRVDSAWGKWGACGRCGRWGRRRRYGMCRVNIVATKYLTDVAKNDSGQPLAHLCTEGMMFLEAFPKGVWCRSKYLPSCIKNLTAVRTRRNEIMLKMCKVPCKENVIFSVITSKGVVLEQANNSAGIYSLAQAPPPQSPPPVRDIVFAVNGAPRTLRCPGTCLSDAPVTWKAGNKPIIEALVALDSNGRVTVNARDHLVFKAVYHSDANLYSCWQEGNLCGEVKLEVWEGGRTDNNRFLLAVAILGAFYTFKVLTRSRARRRRV